MLNIQDGKNDREITHQILLKTFTSLSCINIYHVKLHLFRRVRSHRFHLSAKGAKNATLNIFPPKMLPLN